MNVKELAQILSNLPDRFQESVIPLSWGSEWYEISSIEARESFNDVMLNLEKKR